MSNILVPDKSYDKYSIFDTRYLPDLKKECATEVIYIKL